MLLLQKSSGSNLSLLIYMFQLLHHLFYGVITQVRLICPAVCCFMLEQSTLKQTSTLSMIKFYEDNCLSNLFLQWTTMLIHSQSHCLPLSFSFYVTILGFCRYPFDCGGMYVEEQDSVTTELSFTNSSTTDLLSTTYSSALRSQSICNNHHSKLHFFRKITTSLNIELIT